MNTITDKINSAVIMVFSFYTLSKKSIDLKNITKQMRPAIRRMIVIMSFYFLFPAWICQIVCLVDGDRVKVSADKGLDIFGENIGTQKPYQNENIFFILEW